MRLGTDELGLKDYGPRSPTGELVKPRATLRHCLRMRPWCRARTPSGPLCLAFPFSCNSKKGWCTPRGHVMNYGSYAFYAMLAILMLCCNVRDLGKLE